MQTSIKTGQLEELLQEAPLLRRRYDVDLHGGRSVVITGDPEAWSETARDIESGGAQVVAFHDIRRRKRESSFEGRPIVEGPGPAAAEDAVYVFAGSPVKGWFNPSSDVLDGCLFHGEVPKWQQKGWHQPKLWDEESDRVAELYSMLADEASRQILLGIVKARIEGNTGYSGISHFREYEHPVVQAVQGDVVVDAGAFTGDMTKVYSRRVGKKGRVVAMEPEPKNYVELARGAEKWGNVVPLCVGAWSGNETLTFSAGGGASSRISDGGDTTIAVTPIDEVVSTHRLGRVDLVKMDVEGAEEEAIRGAEATLRRHRPKLQISVYHKPEDLLGLPDMLRPLLPNYRFYLGHHSYYHMETDLYAIPIEKWTKRRVKNWFRRR